MVFAAEFFSHVISAGLGFAAFCLLMRRGTAPTPGWSRAPPACSPASPSPSSSRPAWSGAVLFFYALARAAAGCGAAPPTPPAPWPGRCRCSPSTPGRFGNPFKLAYSDAVALPGRSGHDVARAEQRRLLRHHRCRASTAPSDLLFAGRGLLVLTPIVVMAVVGVVLMRRGHRAEAQHDPRGRGRLLRLQLGYWLPFGGGTPGPRFLIPALPVRRHRPRLRVPAPPRADARPRDPVGVWMLAGTLTYPLIGKQGTGTWADWLVEGTPRAHRPDRPRRDQRLARRRCRSVAAVADRDRPRGARHAGHLALPTTAAPYPRCSRWACVSTVGPGDRPVTRSAPLNRGNIVRALAGRGGRVSRWSTLSVVRLRERRTQSDPAAPAARRSAGSRRARVRRADLVDDQPGRAGRRVQPAGPRSACAARPPAACPRSRPRWRTTRARRRSPAARGRSRASGKSPCSRPGRARRRDWCSRGR